MSFLAVYHDHSRAAICCDSRAISFGASGEILPLADSVPKFILCGSLIFAAVGASDVCGRLTRGVRKVVAENPSLRLAELAGLLPGIRVFSGTTNTSGVASVDVFEVWIEATD
jgi:hypothetical protein